MTTNNDNEPIPLVPPQLPPFLANMYNLKPIVGIPSREEVKLVHETVRAVNNFLHAPELRNTDLSTELPQHLFDIQMVCHRQKYPASVLPNEVVYDPPRLPSYIPVELKSITGPPSNQEVASVHTALRISQSIANMPSIFDSDVHVELSQHLFDIQLARHVQRSMVSRSTPNVLVPQNQTVGRRNSGGTDASSNPGMRIASDTVLQEAAEPTLAIVEQPNFPNEVTSRHDPNESTELGDIKELMVKIWDTLKNLNRVMVGSQNSLARGFNSSYWHGNSGCDPGVHSLINDYGEVPEKHNLPTFQSAVGSRINAKLSVNDFTENILARYLRFYSIGDEMVDEGEELKIKSGMTDDARRLLSERIFLNRG